MGRFWGKRQRTPELLKALELAGGAVTVAKALGITRQAVYQWKRVPEYDLDYFTGATGLSRKQLRPDLYQ